MNLSAPSKPVFWISVVIAIIALLTVMNIIPNPLGAAWTALIAYILLFLGNVLKGF